MSDIMMIIIRVIMLVISSIIVGKIFEHNEPKNESPKYKYKK